MRVFSISEVQNRLVQLTEAATRGEAFAIAKSGKPVVRVLPYSADQKPPKRLGFMPDIAVPDDFDDGFCTETEALFAGDGK